MEKTKQCKCGDGKCDSGCGHGGCSCHGCECGNYEKETAKKSKKSIKVKEI